MKMDKVSTLSNCVDDKTIHQSKDDMNKWSPENIRFYSKGNKSYI